LRDLPTAVQNGPLRSCPKENGPGCW
jgi:hypothetical protein